MTTSRSKTKKKATAPARRKDVILVNVTASAGKVGADYRQTRYEELSMRAIVEQGGAEYILSRPNHPYYMQMLQFVTERAWGKVPQEVKNKLEVMPAVALPPKEPEQIPDAQYQVLTPGTALLPAKADGSTDHLESPGGAADHLPASE